MTARPPHRGSALAGPAAASIVLHAAAFGAVAGLIGWFGGAGAAERPLTIGFGPAPQLQAPAAAAEPEPEVIWCGDSPEPQVAPVPEEFPVSTFEALVSSDAAAAWFQAPPRERSERRPPTAAAAAPAAAPSADPAPATAADPALAAAPSASAASAPAASPAAVTEAARIRADTCPAPDYPRQARRRGQEGTVWLRLRVTETGLPAEVILEQSSGHALLDEAALAAARGWTLLPATRDGAPVAGLLRVPVTFRIAAAG